VLDKRKNAHVVRPGTPWKPRLADDVKEIITGAFSEALTESGYALHDNAEATITVEVARFDVGWRAGLSVPVTARVALDVAVETADGELRERLAESFTSVAPPTQMAYGSAAPAGPVAESVLGTCLTETVLTFFKNSGFLALLEGYSPGQMPHHGAVVSAGGSGFLVARDLVVSNHHVVENAFSIKCVVRGRPTPAAVIAHDLENDLALLRLATAAPADIPVFTVSDSSAVERGQAVCTLGFPLTDILGTDIQVSSGIISNLAGYKGSSSEFQVEMSIHPGNSGGPLLNNGGSVVGVMTRKLGLGLIAVKGDVPESVAFATRSAHLFALAAAGGVRESLKASTTSLGELELSDLVNRHGDAVVRIEVERPAK
jgi:S1-C subfamily serine protease